MKFKRVEIQAFKSYLCRQDGTFDFTVKEGKPADLVSIYAPNGFGKTSFYDAIDFCMTNNITRFIRDPSLANVNNSDAKGLNQSGQKQHILRTKNAPEDIESIVQITTTDDKGPIKRKVPSASNGNKDYTFNDKKTEPKDRYFRSVMLSQEAIDGFLRELKPETRYEQFMAQQLGGDDTLEKNRQHIQLMLKELNSRLDKIQNKVEEIKKKNLSLESGEETVIDVSCLTAINELASELNEQGGHFPVFDNSFDDELNAKLRLQIEQLQEKANQNIELIQTEKSQLEKLVDSFHIFEKKHNEIKELNSEISKLSKQKSNIEQLQLLHEKKSLLTEQFDTQRVFFEKLQSFEKRLPDFVKQMQTKSGYNGELTVLRENLTGKEQKFKISYSVLGELEEQKTILLNKIEKLETKRSEAVKIFSEIVRIEEKIRQQNGVELALKGIELKSNIVDLKSEGMTVKNFKVEELDLIIASKFNSDILLKIAKDYSTAIITQKSLNKQLNDLNHSLDAVELQKDSVANLIKLGSQLINHSQERHCPLCQHKHESFAALADAINSNSSLSDSQKRLLKEIEDCQTLLKEEVNKLKKLKEDFLVAQEKRLTFLREQLQESLKEHKSITKILEQVEKDKVEVNRLKGLTLQKTPELFQSFINDEIEKNKENCSSLESQIDKTKVECQRLTEEAQKLRVDFATLVSKSQNTDDLLVNDLLLLVELEVPPEIIEPKLNNQKLDEIIASHLKKAMDLFGGMQQEVKDNNDAIKILTAQYTMSFFENPTSKIEDLTFNISKSSEELVRLNEFVREFYTIVKELGEERLLGGSNWGGLKQKFAYKISNLYDLRKQNTELISRLISLTTLAEQVLKYINFVKSTDEQQKLELEIGKYEGIKEAFLTDLRRINEVLESQVNQYFHVDLINTIYKKIDPHPDFKKSILSVAFLKMENQNFKCTLLMKMEIMQFHRH